jgi:hypothetical protein
MQLLIMQLIVVYFVTVNSNCAQAQKCAWEKYLIMANMRNSIQRANHLALVTPRVVNWWRTVAASFFEDGILRHLFTTLWGLVLLGSFIEQYRPERNNN